MRITEIITLSILKHKDTGLTLAASAPSSNICENTVNRQIESVPIEAKKHEILVLRVVNVLDWDGLRLPVVVSAMIDENYMVEGG